MRHLSRASTAPHAPAPGTGARTRLGLLTTLTAAAALGSGLLVPSGAPAAPSSGPTLTTRPAALAATALTVVPAALSAPSARSAASTRAAVSAPSGQTMPRGSTAVWRQVFRDDFTGTRLTKPWTTYSGTPGGGAGGQWKPSHAVVSGGALHLRTYREHGRWVSAGVGAWDGPAMKYGRIDVRFRAQRATGVGYTLLLWPAGGGWPPEIDFAEDGGGNRRTTTATLHHGPGNSQVQRRVSSNFAAWHTLGVIWSPGTIVYTLDGRAWGTVKQPGVPNVGMVLAIQSQTWNCGRGHTCPNASTPARSSVDVDWVVAYKHR